MASPGSSRASRAGVVLLLLGGAPAAGLALTTPFGGCTDVGVEPGANTGFAFLGVDDGDFVYTPDGANECRSPVEVALPPLAGLLGGAALVLYDRFSTAQSDV